MRARLIAKGAPGPSQAGEGETGADAPAESAVVVSEDAEAPPAAEPEVTDERSGGENAGAAEAEDAWERSEGE